MKLTPIFVSDGNYYCSRANFCCRSLDTSKMILLEVPNIKKRRMLIFVMTAFRRWRSNGLIKEAPKTGNFDGRRRTTPSMTVRKNCELTHSFNAYVHSSVRTPLLARRHQNRTNFFIWRQFHSELLLCRLILLLLLTHVSSFLGGLTFTTN